MSVVLCVLLLFNFVLFGLGDSFWICTASFFLACSNHLFLDFTIDHIHSAMWFFSVTTCCWVADRYNTALVCHRWRFLACHPRLWLRVDRAVKDLSQPGVYPNIEMAVSAARLAFCFSLFSLLWSSSYKLASYMDAVQAWRHYTDCCRRQPSCVKYSDWKATLLGNFKMLTSDYFIYLKRTRCWVFWCVLNLLRFLIVILKLYIYVKSHCSYFHSYDALGTKIFFLAI